MSWGWGAPYVPGVIVRWIAADGRLLGEQRVGIRRQTPLTLRLPPGAQLVTLEGIDDPRSRVELGPGSRVVTPADRGRWWRRR